MRQIDFGQKVRQRRMELGLAAETVAQAAGISDHEYVLHVESDPDCVVAVSALREVRNLCSALKVDVFWLLDLSCAFCEGVRRTPEYKLPRNEPISQTRRKRGWSRSDLGNRVNFLEPGIAKLEEDESEIENWRLENLEKIAAALEIPFQVLLGVSCPRCGL